MERVKSEVLVEKMKKRSILHYGSNRVNGSAGLLHGSSFNS